MVVSSGRPHAFGLPRRVITFEGVDVDVVVGEHTERRDDLFAEVLVLVVAPHHHDVGCELVEGISAARQVLDQ